MKKILFSNTLAMLLVALMGMLTVSSCIKDEGANKECDITSAAVVGEEYEKYFSDKSKMSVANIGSTETEIAFEVRSLSALPEQMPVSFEITAGATVEPANGSMQNFKNGPVTYTVTSQDGQWKRHYKISFKEPVLPTFTFSFENVEESAKTTGGSTYHKFFELSPSNGERLDMWASGNEGAALTLPGSKPEDFPTSSVAQGYQGKGLCLKTISAGSLGVMFMRPIAAGSLFMGKFLVENVLANTLKATRFGIPVDNEPVRVTGYYKYKPGEKFTDKQMRTVEGHTDEASIYAVFYKNKDSQGNDYYLYGDDMLDLDNLLKNNPQVVKMARVKSLPATDTWTPFEMEFEGKDVDNKEVMEKKYNLALVFSSSKDGAQFEGAIGSTLYIDEVKISFEKFDATTSKEATK